MISEKETVRISKMLSLVLRHKPATINIILDENGWTDVALLIKQMNSHGYPLTKEVLQNVVDTNNKKRFAFNYDRTKIRASQGHSLPVNLDYKPQTPPQILFHGTGEKFVNAILENGLNKMGRNHVHLSRINN